MKGVYLLGIVAAFVALGITAALVPGVPKPPAPPPPSPDPSPAPAGDRSILAVHGLSSTTPAFRAALADMAARHGWDVDALATIMSRESGFKSAAENPLPGQTAVGLIQFTASTLTRLGWTGTRDEFAALSGEAQLPYVERYFAAAFPHAPERPVDYYLAVLGQPPGLPLEHVLWSAGDRTYEVNKGLDLDKNGVITVSDIANAVAQTMAAAHSVRLDTQGTVA